MTNSSALLRSLASRYIWWRDAEPPSDDRIIAQVMHIGTYDDVRRLEATYEPVDLRAVMLRAQPGWIGKRSWSFWRARLSHAGAGPVPEAPPRRSFHTLVPQYFAGTDLGPANDPLRTADETMPAASPEDRMAAKLKIILDRVEARDYRDIAEMLRQGISLEHGLAAFKAVFGGEPMTVLRALCFFEDGNLAALDDADRKVLTAAAARVGDGPPPTVDDEELPDSEDLVDTIRRRIEPLGGIELVLPPRQPMRDPPDLE